MTTGQWKSREGCEDPKYLVKWVLVAEDPPRIANHFQSTAAYQGHGEPDEAAGEQALDSETDKTEREEDNEGGVGAERWSVCIVR